MFGRMEDEGRMGWQRGVGRFEGTNHLWMRITQDEHLNLLAMVAAGLVLSGRETIENFEAILTNREVL